MARWPGELSLRAYGAAPGSHSHAWHQVLVGVEGTLELEVEGRGQRVAPGGFALVAPGDRHDFEARGGARCLVLDSAHAGWGRCRSEPAQPTVVQSLAAYLAQALAAGQPLAGLHGPALLLEAWRPVETPRRPRRAIDWQALAGWVQAHLHEPLEVAQLAERACLAPSQFAARCQEALGVSPRRWLQQQRLAQARQLRALGLPVAEVARRTGYRSPSALTAALRGGCAPQERRR